MDSWNKHLKRLLWKHFGDQPVPAELKQLLQTISISFDNYEREHALLNRVMNLSSEELFDANTELRKRNEELDRFVYSTSHDLRAPLTSILGLLQLIDLAKDPKDIETYLSQIKTSTVQLDNFIQDIVAYTHNKKTEIERTEIDFEQMTRDCFKKLEFMSNAHLLRKEVKMKSSIPYHSDKQRLDNVLSNLISNAIKYYNPEQSDPFIELTFDVTKESAEIRVEDNGMGISENHLKNIFDMFYRASPVSKGSGIGLYIVSEIIETLNGQIEVTSERGKGTAFLITLPVSV